MFKKVIIYLSKIRQDTRNLLVVQKIGLKN